MFKLKPAGFLKRDEVMLHLAAGGLEKKWMNWQIFNCLGI
jgi:hypothetical protein